MVICHHASLPTVNLIYATISSILKHAHLWFQEQLFSVTDTGTLYCTMGPFVIANNPFSGSDCVVAGTPGEKGERGSPGTGQRGQRGLSGPPGKTSDITSQVQ